MQHGHPVAIVEEWQDAANRHDIDRLVALSDPDIAISGPRGSGRGHQVLRDWLGRAGLTLAARRFFVRGDVVVVAQHGVWRSVETGDVAGEADVASCFRVDGRRVVRVARFDALDAALAAAGLDERDEIDLPIELSKNRAWPLLARLNAALDAGEIDEAGWYREVAAVIVPAYLAGDNPRAQSGSDGDDDHWTYARGLLAEAIDRDGTFLDVGCASGYLMECLERWGRERGHRIEPYGLDIAPELADLARRRLPHWADRIFVGNAMDWAPPRRFDYVRTGLEYVPPRRQRDLVARLLREAVAPGGRLIIGTFSEEREETRPGPSDEERAAAWGHAIAGRVERPHRRDARLVYRAFWIDRGSG